jgi:thiosulfate/3-mercaptopyruvate sulfurtransferase
MDGGHAAWVRERRPLAREEPTFAPSVYACQAGAPAPIRASLTEVRARLGDAGTILIDARPASQYAGSVFSASAIPPAAPTAVEFRGQ